MDQFIAALEYQLDDDLRLCRGVAYQADMTPSVEYADGYWQKVMAYEDTVISRKVNRGRCALLARHIKRSASVLDIGAGTGAFVKAARSVGFEAYGYDVMPQSVAALGDLYDADVERFSAVTMWDSLEHMAHPGEWLARMRAESWLFVSIPIFKSLSEIRDSKHYRPGEHLYYVTADGLINWLRCYGFVFIERSDHETQAGRDSIGAFAFRRSEC